MGSTETLVIEGWINSTLLADTTITNAVGQRVAEGQAKEDWVEPIYPMILFQEQSPPRDIHGVGATIIMVEGLYLIKAIVEGDSYVPAQPLAERINFLFHDKTVATAGGEIFSSVRERPFRMPEVDSGVDYRHLGAIYRIQAK